MNIEAFRKIVPKVRTKTHYETTLEHVQDYCGIVTNLGGFEKIIKLMKQIEVGKTDYNDISDARVSRFLEKHKLIDIRKIRYSTVGKSKGSL